MTPSSKSPRRTVLPPTAATPLLLLLALILACAGNNKRPPPVDPLQQTFGVLSENIKLEWKHDDLALSYCPATNCLRFLTDGKNGPGSLVDFAFFYLHEIAEDPELADFQKQDSPGGFSRILDERRSLCTEEGMDPKTAKDPALATCILRALHAKYEIRAERLHFDKNGSYRANAVGLAERLQSH